MSLDPEQLKLLAKRFYEEVLNRGDVLAIDELVADDFVEHEGLPGIPAGREGLRAWVMLLRGAFPDLVVTVEQMIAAGDEVWVHMTIRGTHYGPFFDIAATGKKVEIGGIDRVRVRDGKAVEHWGVVDNLALFQQLGRIPG